jgi:hypothetical protein
MGNVVKIEDKVLSIEEMLAADDVQFAVVKAWNGNVRIGSLSASDMIEFVESNEGPAKRTAGLRLIIKSLVDAKGDRIGDMKHLEAFGKKNAQVTNRIVAEILKLNGLDEAAKKALGNASSEVDTDASPTA